MKKVILGFILGGILFSEITVLATNYLAKDVTYNKNGQATVESALNDLYNKTISNGINLSPFNNGGYAVLPNAFDGGTTTSDGNWYTSSSTIDYNFKSSDDFEISADVYINNDTESNLGEFLIYFYNNNSQVGYLYFGDAWAGSVLTRITFNLKSTVHTLDDSNSVINGKYSMVRKNNKLYVYKDSTLLNTVDFDSSIEFNKIKIEFRKLKNTKLDGKDVTLLPVYLKKLYIGDVRNNS